MKIQPFRSFEFAEVSFCYLEKRISEMLKSLDLYTIQCAYHYTLTVLKFSQCITMIHIRDESHHIAYHSLLSIQFSDKWFLFYQLMLIHLVKKKIILSYIVFPLESFQKVFNLLKINDKENINWINLFAQQRTGESWEKKEIHEINQIRIDR